MVFEFLKDVFIENFVVPHGRYYTPLSTAVYALLFVGAVWLVYEYVLKKMKIQINVAFMRALVPFIILGGLTRNVGDIVLAYAPSSPLRIALITPGVYVTLFLLTLAVLIISLRISAMKKIPYWKPMFAIGVVLDAIALGFISSFGFVNPQAFLQVGAILGGWALLLYAIHKKAPKLLTRENWLILTAHMFDASATFTALTFYTGLVEEHVLANFLIHGFGLGPAAMFLMKLAVVWPVLYYTDRVGDTEYRTWLKIVILILGLALGVRDVMAIALLGQPA